MRKRAEKNSKETEAEATKAVAETPKNPEPQATALPLFFQNPAVLDFARHAKASILPTANYAFTAPANSIPLNAIEFIEAVKSYPIVFTMGDEPLPVAILGFGAQNAFLESDGSWAANSYIPAYARQYPFIFLERDDTFYLCVDEASPQFSATPSSNGQAMYEEDGSPSALAKHALQFCTQYYQHRNVTKQFMADLLAHNLLTPYQSEYKKNDGSSLQLTGFQIINEAAFNALSETDFNVLRSKGWLPFIYLSLASFSNWKTLADRLEAASQK